MVEHLSVVGEMISLLTELGVLSDLSAIDLRQSRVALSGDVDVLLDHLVETGALTYFQRMAIRTGKARSLRKGNYLLLNEIGEGGMGVVFKARHVRMERVVALKMLRTDRSAGANNLLRFRREVLTAARLLHPNIVTAFDADECDGQNFFVMEYIEGLNLAQWSRSTSRLPVAAILEVITQVAAGLQYAHDHGTVHRDIKPANLMRTHAGTVKILDLGLARMMVPDPSDAALNNVLQTETGTLLGTVAFMAPEQAEQTSVDAKADMYSLGCTLYFLLTGCPPYAASTALGLLEAHRSAPIPQLTALRPGVTPEIQEILNRMLAKVPQDRFANMNAFISAVNGLDFDQLETVITERALPDSMEEVISTAGNQADVTRIAIPQTPPEVQPVSTVPPNRSRRRLAGAAQWGGFAVLLILAGILFKIRTPDGDVTVESSRRDLNVSFNGERSFSLGTAEEAEKLSFTTSSEGMRVEAGNVKALTREVVLDPGTDNEIRVTMSPPSNLPDAMAAGVVDQAAFDQRIGPLIESDTWIAKWSKQLLADSGDALAQTCRGNRLNELGQVDLALYDHLEAVRKQPRLAVAWSNLGHSYENLKQSDKAIDAYTKAIELEPHDSVYRLNRARTLQQLNRFEESLADLNVAIGLPSKDIWVLATRADVLVALNRDDEALRDLTEAAGLDPSNPVGWVLRAQYYVGHNLPEEAISDYSTALQLSPATSVWRSDRARCLMQLNRFAEAIIDLNEALRTEPGRAHWLQQRGTAYLKSNMREKAISDFAAARRIDMSIAVPAEILNEVQATEGEVRVLSQQNVPIV